MNLRVAFTGLAALALMHGAAAQDDRNSYYWSNGARVAVVVAPSSVALRFSMEPDAELIASVGRQNGLTPSDSGLYSPLRAAREVVYTAAGAAPITNRYLSDLRGRLAQNSPTVVDVARVLTTATGAVAAMPQTLSVGFVEGVSGLSDLRGLDVVNSVSVVRTLNERPLIVSYRVNADSDRTALEVANTIFEYRDASGRRLVTYAVPTLRFPGEFRAVPNVPRHPNDDLYSDQWHLNDSAKADVNAPEAWDYARGAAKPWPLAGCSASQRIRVAVLDNGVETTHADLATNMSQDGKDYTSLPPGDDPNPSESTDRHGTQAAGVIAACGNNATGVSGVCPLCEILPIKINPSNVDETLVALFAARDLGADVISNSWGREITDDLRMALDAITGTSPPGPGIPVFFAVPNPTTVNGCATDISGAESVIAVGGSSSTDLAGSTSSSGACLDLVAPTAHHEAFTGMIVTTDVTAVSPATDYTSDTNGFGGTSSATALAAGIGGLVLSVNPTLTQRDVRNILQHTAVRIGTLVGSYDNDGFNPQAGYGRVDAHRAVVPFARISTSKHVVQVNEPFDITVTASAPHLLASIGWSRSVGTCPAGIEEWRPVDGTAFHEETWSGLQLASPGVYRFYPNAKDSFWPANDDYPHIASAAFPKLDEIVIEVQGPGTPAASGCTTPSPPTNLRIDR